MIAGLIGTLIEKREKSAIIDVQGVRYEVNLTKLTLGKLARVGQNVEIVTRLIPSESAFTLYGFLTLQEQKLFDLLVTVTGVGPKLALNILEIGPAKEIITAIAQEKTEYFQRVTRLGRKTAAKIILDLKNKIDETFPASAKTGHVEISGPDLAIQALVELGYNSLEAKNALAQVTETDLSARIREALKNLGSPTTITK